MVDPFCLLPRIVAVDFGKDKGELPPSPIHRWDPQPSLEFSTELSRNSPRRSVTRERDDPSLNKLFSFPRIKGRKRGGGEVLLDQDWKIKEHKAGKPPPVLPAESSPSSFPAPSQEFYSQSS